MILQLFPARTVLVVGAGWLALGSAEAAETLDEAIAAAMRSNPGIAVRREQAEGARENLNAVFSGYFPKLLISGSAGRGQPSTATGVAIADQLQQRTLGYSAEIDQPLFDGLRTVHAAEEAREAALAADEDLAAYRLQVEMLVVHSYMAVLGGRSQVTLLGRSVAALQADLTFLGQQLKAGETTRTDLDLTTQRLAAARNAVASAEAGLAQAAAEFEQATGAPPPALAQPAMADAALPGSLEALLAAALKVHPSVLAAIHRERSASGSVGKAEADFYPQVGLRAAYSRGYTDPAALTDGPDAQVTAQVTLPVSLGGETIARVRQAKALLRQRRHETAAERAELRAMLTASWGRLAAARQRIKFARQAVEASEHALAGLRVQRKAGERTTLEVLDAQRDLIGAQQQQIQSRSDLVIAEHEVLAGIGHEPAAAAQ